MFTGYLSPYKKGVLLEDSQAVFITSTSSLRDFSVCGDMLMYSTLNSESCSAILGVNNSPLVEKYGEMSMLLRSLIQSIKIDDKSGSPKPLRQTAVCKNVSIQSRQCFHTSLLMLLCLGVTSSEWGQYLQAFWQNEHNSTL